MKQRPQAAVLSISFPKILAALGVLGAFCLYAGFNVLGFCLIFLFLPETKQRTLEELDYVFAVPVGRFVRYQFAQAVPYWFRRWVLFRRGAALAPLYHFDRDDDDDAALDAARRAEGARRQQEQEQELRLASKDGGRGEAMEKGSGSGSPVGGDEKAVVEHAQDMSSAPAENGGNRGGEKM
jgi:hypothetical protein